MEFKEEPASSHGDTVTDISFDFHGQRFATCSLDKSIRVWSQGERPEDGATVWKAFEIQGAHSDSIWRLAWSHPEFGQIISSCSEDGTVCIWEEQGTISKGGREASWSRKATLSESKQAVRDVKFAPRYLGLKVATASADGLVRIYEATDIFSLTLWHMQVRYCPCYIEAHRYCDASSYFYSIADVVIHPWFHACPKYLVWRKDVDSLCTYEYVSICMSWVTWVGTRTTGNVRGRRYQSPRCGRAQCFGEWTHVFGVE
jgi:WD40 repeat protein